MENVKNTSGQSKYSVDRLRKACYDVVVSEGKFLPRTAIAKLTGVHRGTLLKYGIDTDEICALAGFPRKDLRGKTSKEDIRQEFLSGYINFIKERGRSTSFYTYLKYLGVSDAQISRYYRWEIDLEECHNLAGVSYVENHGIDIDHVQETLRRLIQERKRYITSQELSEELSVSRSLLDIRRNSERIGLKKINLEHGYKLDRYSFERRVGELLGKVFPGVEIFTQKSFPDLKGLSPDRRSILRYDFYLPSENLLVEADGPGHFVPGCMYFSEEVVRRDALKNEYAAKNGIRLIRVRFDEKLTQEYIERLLSGNP